MKNILLFLLSVSIATAVILFIIKKPTPPKQEVIPTKPAAKKQVFSLETAPSGTLRGTIVSSSGDIEWQSRIASEAAALTDNVTLQQGESLKTKKKAAISFKFGSSQVDLGPEAEINIIQTLPAYIVYEQIAGTIKYSKSDSTPLAIRSLHLLVEPTVGEISVAVDKKQEIITVETTTASATVGFNSAESITTKVEIPKFRRYTFNDKKRTGKITPID